MGAISTIVPWASLVTWLASGCPSDVHVRGDKGHGGYINEGYVVAEIKVN